MARKAPPPRGPQLDLAGDLSVAFANTAGARKKNRQLGVGSYADLLTWGQRAGVLSTATAERLSRQAVDKPWQAKAAFAAAEKLRSALSRIFSSISAGAGPAAADLDTVNDALARAMPAVRLVQSEHGVIWGWAGGEDALDQVLWPVLLAAAGLLTSEEGRPRIRQCAAESCPLFFAERSPARERIWCEMKSCGARDRSLRYYHRTGKFVEKKNWLYR
ncbi:MAG: ABATE domain-containing protein [Thermoanaerobaculia bacterium]